MSLDNYVSPLDNIDSDCIVGIQCDFPGYDTLYILGVYLPSSSHNIVVYDEYFDYMWTLCESLSSRGMVLVMGDFNGDLGNSLGDKGKLEPNLHGLKLLDFANYFNLCPVNLMKMCTVPLETFNSYCGRFHSTLDFIFLPNCLLSSIKFAKTFDEDVDSMSDHLPIQLKLHYTVSDSVLTCDEGSRDSRLKLKIHWSKFPYKTINKMYRLPLLLDLEKISTSSFTDSVATVDKITELLIGHSLPLADTCLKPCKKKSKCAIYVKHPADIKIPRSQCKAAFVSWKDNEYPGNNVIHSVHCSKPKDYRSRLRCFLNQVETDKIKKLCNAVSTDEKLFWKLLKGQHSSSQMSSSLVDGKFITDKKQIREMWACHFGELGTPSENIQFDSDFLTQVTANVQEIFTSCTDDPSGVLSSPLKYEEVARVCSQLKLGRFVVF